MCQRENSRTTPAIGNIQSSTIVQELSHDLYIHILASQLVASGVE